VRARPVKSAPVAVLSRCTDRGPPLHTTYGPDQLQGRSPGLVGDTRHTAKLTSLNA